MVDKRRSVCLFCSLGCGYLLRTSADQVTAIDYDKENPVNLGTLCPRGHYNLELINHPNRLTSPMIGNEAVKWDEALSYAKKQLKGCDASSLGILMYANASNEDAYLAARMALELGTVNISAAGDAADLEAYEGLKWEVEGSLSAKLEQIAESDALLIVGDILVRSPVLSKRVNQVKYGKRGNQVIVIDPNISHTSWFATIHLRNRPGTEAVVMAAIYKVILEENKKGKLDFDMNKAAEISGVPADMIVRAAKAFDDAESGTALFAPGAGKERNDLIEFFTRAASGASVNKRSLTFYGFGNNLGVNMILDNMVEGRVSYDEAASKKALFMFGDDSNVPKGCEFALRSCFFMPKDVRKGDVILPLASHMERKGSVIYSGGRMKVFKPLAHKVGGRSNMEIISSLMGWKTDYNLIMNETNSVLAKGVPQEKVDVKHMLAEAMKLETKSEAVQDDITHFGNNNLVKNFYWYRVNNG